MSDGEESAIKLALRARQMRAQIREVMAADPIAVIGMACRLPGADGVDAYWRLLMAGDSAVGTVPADRWDADAWYDADIATAGRSVTRHGAFVDGIDQFDAAYFDILPREADAMDPQQRLFLEVATDALDDAGLPRQALRGSRTGVYAASYHNDYAQLAFADADAIDPRTLTGTLHSVLPNRLSYLLDLRGPSVSVDTACSASLVAVHLACQSLRFAESDVAIAGGVSVMAAPELMVAMSKVGFMAPDGQCKPFSALADGFGRGEGCAVVVLKRLSDALTDGDRVLGVIRGSAVNQDGRSTVLSAPNGPAQEALIRDALDAARMAPSRIGYVEAHGTGTALGDPIEIGALAATIGVPVADTPPCYVGSAKANIGHLEAGAGIAGLVKALLTIQHATVPPQPGFGAINPHIDLAGSRLTIARTATPWPAGRAPRAAAVSSFGVGGTNAHVILEEAPTIPVAPITDPAPLILPLSARSPEALTASIAGWRAFLSVTTDDVRDIAYSAARRRTHQPFRTAVVGSTADEMRAALDHIAPSAPASGPGRLGFVFSGQGAQWLGMGAALMADPTYRAVIERCDAILRPLAGWSLIALLSAGPGDDRLGETIVAQPALFAVQAGIAAWLADRGIVPDVVVGHSVGEITALHVAGVLPLAEAMRIVWHRGRIMQAATGSGRMAQVAIDETAAVALVAHYPGLDIAAINAPGSIVLSGDPASLDAALAEITGETRMLPVDYAFHSAQMEPFRAPLVAAIGAVASMGGRIPVYSSVTGAPIDGPIDAAYFARNMREPVRFAAAALAMLADGCTTFAEIAPHPVLGAALVACADQVKSAVAVIPTLRRGQDGARAMLNACARLYAAGVDPDWTRLAPVGRSVALPAYPWQRQRHWLARSVASPPRSNDHPLLGRRDPTGFVADGRAIAHWSAEHRVFGRRVVPGAALIEALVQLAKQAGPAGGAVCNVVIQRPLMIDETDPAATHWRFTVEEERGVAIVACRLPDGEIVAQAEPGDAPPWHPIAAPPGDTAIATLPDDSDRMRRGLDFGPMFRRLSDVRIADDVAAATVAGLAGDGFALHPALLDAAFQLAAMAADRRRPGVAALVPVAADAVQLSPHHGGPLIARARLYDAGSPVRADVSLETPEGHVVAHIRGLRLVAGDALDRGDDDLYTVAWHDAPDAAFPSHLRWLVTGADATANAVVAAALGAVIGANDGAALPVGTDGVVFVAQGEDVIAPLEALMTLAQRLVAAHPSPRLAIVTRGGQAATAADAPPDPGAAASWALGDVIAAEHPELDVRIVDVADLATDAAMLAECIGGDVPMLALRGGRALVPRLARLAVRPIVGAAQDRWVVAEPGTFDGLARRPVIEQPLAADAVRVAVHAAGLNFRDVLTTMDLYPGTPPPLGVECAGVVTAIGDAVTTLAPGDRVFGYAPGSFAGTVDVPAHHLAAVPAAMSMAAAAGLPVAFLTAWYGLHGLARITAGETVLIHAGTGGVGMAAIQVAQAAGATVFATAGSTAKRAMLVAMGVAGAFDSRSASFADAVLEATDGRGVDIVLNALSDPLIAAGLRTLAPNGRFLEIGKRGVWSAQQVAAFRPDATYHLYDLGTAAEADAALLAPIYARLLAGFASGALRPLPMLVFDMADAPDAMRLMAQARHTGKLVLRMRGNHDALPVRGDASYLITGGLGGIGIETAAHLVARGARHLVLLGRSAPGDAACARIADWRAAGVAVTIEAVDVADAAAMTAMFDRIDGTMPRLAGVVHAAGVVRDAVFTAQRWATARTVVDGKLTGALVLDALTRARPLDFFLLFSSATTVLGAGGQGLYPAANAGLDALARRRRRLGLPALSIGWGLWSGIGMAAAGGADRWAARGLPALAPLRAFAALDRLVAADVAYGLVLPIDWRTFLATLPTGMDATFFADVTQPDRVTGSGPPPAPTQTPPASLPTDLASLRDTPQSGREAALARLVTTLAASVIGLAADAIASDRPLREMGLDSLMSVELRNLLVRAGGVPLPATLLFDRPSVDALTDHLMTMWMLAPTAIPTTAERPGEDDPLADLDEAALRQLLADELRDEPSGTAGGAA